MGFVSILLSLQHPAKVRKPGPECPWSASCEGPDCTAVPFPWVRLLSSLCWPEWWGLVLVGECLHFASVKILSLDASPQIPSNMPDCEKPDSPGNV